MSVSPGQIKPLAGYTQSFGTKQAFIGELVGPLLYATGGQQINAATLGWGGFEMVMATSLSLSGTYFARVQILPVDAAASEFKGAAASVKIVWFVLATGAEAGALDLSGEILRIFAIGV